jgi:hypothetical protein
MPVSDVIAKIVSFLRAGYAYGVPPTELSRRLHCCAGASATTR